MRNVEIKGYGIYLPKNIVKFEDQTRYRIGKDENENQITLATKAIKIALENAKMEIKDIHLIVSASAVGHQPIPCNAALIHEQIAKGTDIPAMDIGTTCTSFITAFDTISYLIEADRYNNVIIVSCDFASIGLNPNQKESYELFSDCAVAVILSKCEDGKAGVLFGMQKTWSEGAHSTEIRGGLTGYDVRKYTGDNLADYQFDMKGRQILTIAARKLPEMFNEFYEKSGITLENVDMVVPHQASKALGLIMKKLNIPENKYINMVADYGNMVSSSVPFAMCRAIQDGKIKKGDTILLVGTAAGLTSNILAIKY